uniref:Uncharacterized protein n=1 Tax=Physcomitrium patens TaxID=3218 RepID=A0A2K1KKG7_PHYPA|nr:hypothetical protein PHYPA_007943 [Physcomitrium patens]
MVVSCVKTCLEWLLFVSHESNCSTLLLFCRGCVCGPSMNAESPPLIVRPTSVTVSAAICDFMRIPPPAHCSAD